MRIRRGEMDINDVLTMAGELERRVEDLLTTSPLPEQPDYERVNAWLVDTYADYWSEEGKWSQ